MQQCNNTGRASAEVRIQSLGHDGGFELIEERVNDLSERDIKDISQLVAGWILQFTMNNGELVNG